MRSECMWLLAGEDTSAVFFSASDGDIPQLIWFGESFQNTFDSASLATLVDLALPMAKLDTAVALDIFPQASTGIDCHPALRGHRNGHRFNHRLCCSSVAHDNNQLAVVLADDATEIQATITFTLHEASGVLGINTQLKNIGSSAFHIEWLASATVALPSSHTECLHLHGRWGLECQQHRQSIGPHRLLLENNRGRTSHELYPAAITGAAGFNDNQGDVLAMHLAWSGSHRTVIEKLSDGRAYLQTGVASDVGELILSADESIQSPTAYIARGNCNQSSYIQSRSIQSRNSAHNKPGDHLPAVKYFAGTNAASQRMHQFVRSEILPPFTRTPRPVHANSWEALYFDHDIDKLKDLIKSVSSLGAERFVLDDGWFPARRADTAGLGDWIVDKSVYPDGLHPVVNAVRAENMQFGLWFEPEMVNPDSDLYRSHPDWVCHLQPFETPLARHQLVLNLALQPVQDYLYKKISTLVAEYAIDYIKWDHNRDMVMAGDGHTSQMQKQVDGCYQLINRLNKQFPGLEIESCSSGGARADWGILQYTGRVWTSDSIDAVDRLRIQRGYSLFNPPEITGAHIGHEVAHLTGRAIDIHTRAIVALQGQFGFELNATAIDQDEANTIRHYVALYKKHRQWISEATCWRLDSSVDHLLMNGMVDTEKKQSLWTVVAESSLSATTPGKLLPVGLDPQLNYRVELVSDNLEQIAHYGKRTPAWLESPCHISGELLMKVGLNLPIMPAQSALLLNIHVLNSDNSDSKSNDGNR